MGQLPHDFDETLSKAEQFGILDDDVLTLERRAKLEIESLASAAGAPNNLGVADWAAQTFKHLLAALHAELCSQDGGGLKADYRGVLNQAMTKDGIAKVASVVLKVISAVNPTLAVSTIGLYLA